jgi:dTDP-4-amino-4,6-dideoxygalactose transaminase
VERPDHFHVYNQFVIRVPAAARDPLRAHLSERRIGTEIYYPVPLHLQTCFAALGHAPGDFPVAEAAARETIALPMYPELSLEAQRQVVGAIADYFEQEGRMLGTIGPIVPRVGDVQEHAA